MKKIFFVILFSLIYSFKSKGQATDFGIFLNTEKIYKVSVEGMSHPLREPELIIWGKLEYFKKINELYYPRNGAQLTVALLPPYWGNLKPMLGLHMNLQKDFWGVCAGIQHQTKKINLLSYGIIDLRNKDHKNSFCYVNLRYSVLNRVSIGILYDDILPNGGIGLEYIIIPKRLRVSSYIGANNYYCFGLVFRDI